MAANYTWPQLGGLSTTGNEDGLEQPRLVQAQNLRFVEGMAKRRKGMYRILRSSPSNPTNTAADLNGTTQWATIPLVATIHTLKRLWTFEALVNPDSFATNAKTILGVAHATNYSLRVYFKTDGKLEAKVQDSAATVTTLTSSTTFSTGTTYAIQVVRDGTALTMRVNGATEATGTMADLDCLLPGGDIYLGRDNTTNAFDGKYDFARMEQVAKPDQRYGKHRHHDPRNLVVLFDYPMENQSAAGTERIDDRSRFENHGAFAGSVTTASGNVLSVKNDVTHGIATWIDTDSKVRAWVGMGKSVWTPELVK